MPSTTLNFNNQINTSVQVGDIAYCLELDPSIVGGFETADMSRVQLIGDITNITREFNNYSITCNLPQGTPTGLDPLNVNEPFIMFSKNKSVNCSGIKGYYANVKFVNNSNEEANLFAVSSEIKESSK